jgi:hypothetical protein
MAVTLTFGLASCGSSQHRRKSVEHRITGADAVSSSPLFAPDSVWNAPLSPNAPVDPSSRRFVGRLLQEVASEQQAQNGPWIETVSGSTPLYRVPPNQPLVAVKLDVSQPWARTLRIALQAVPIPSYASPAAGDDAHLTIWQPSTNRLWELWRARKAADGWHAQWGGAMDAVSRSPGYYTTQSWPGARSYWGSTATSLPVIAGTIMIKELERGSIDHALALDLPSARAGVYAWPAQRTDGEDHGADSIPEGARLRLDPNLDIASLGLSPLTQELALAAQRYGMIVRDQTRHAIGFYAEDPAPTGANPYPALMDHMSPSRLLADFPWQHVQVLRMDLTYGTGRPLPQ